MITRSILETAGTLALTSAMGMETAPNKQGVFLYNTTNRTRAQTRTRKKRRAMQKLSRKINRKP